MRKLAIALTCMLAISAMAGFASADNQSNCLATEQVVLFSGTDAGAARRGLNAGTVGCNTASDPRDVPTWTDTNYLTPGATHVIPAITSRPQTSPPGAATFKHQDGTSVAISWRWATDPNTNRWEGQSIVLKSGTGTVSITAIGRTVTYQKAA